MTRKVIDVGLSNNDGTGDSIRDSFKKVNDNFQELYGSLGLGERLKFINLDDSPGSYLGQQGKLLVVNQAQNGLSFKTLASGASMAIDVDEVAGTITLRPLNQDLSNDTTPQLGGDLDARYNGINHKIFNLPSPSGPTEAVNKTYADTKISLGGVDAIDPETGLNNPAFGTMSGALVLSRNPQTSDDDDYEGLIAATKNYVDLSAFKSTSSIYVNLGGTDNRDDIPEDKKGRSPAYAFRTVERALKEAEKLITDSLYELSVYQKRLVYNDGIPCTLSKIEPALNSGSGGLIIPRLSVDTFALRNAGTGYKAGDVLQMGLPSSPGTGTSRASVQILRVSNVNGSILSYSIIGRGNYTALPGVNDVGTTLSLAIAGSVGAGATFNLTYKVSELSVTQAGSGYGPISIIITGGGGSGAAATAIVSNGSISGTTLLSTGSGYTSLPTIDVYLPRLFVFTNGAKTDFSSSLDTLARDIREGLGIKGLTSGAVAEILSHDAQLDDSLSGYPTGTGKNELFDVGIISGQFVDGEELAYGELIKTKNITVQIETGTFEENLPLRVPANISIVGEEFRRTSIRPKPGVSTSPYTQIYFRRDPVIDNLRVTGLFGVNEALNTTATPSARSGTITVTFGSGNTSTNWLGKVWKTSALRGEGVITQILSSTQIKVKIHDQLTSISTIGSGATFTATISGTTLTVSGVSNGTIVDGMEINAVGATSVAIGTYIVSQLSGTTGGQGTYRLNRGSKLLSSTSMYGSQWQIYTVNEYGYHYLTDPSRPIYPLLENSGRNINAATLLGLNKLFIQEEVITNVNLTFTGYNEALCKRDVGLMIDAIIYDLTYGGYSRSVEAALKYYQSASGLIALGLTGTQETGFTEIITGSQKASTLAAISYINTLAEKVVKNEEITKTNSNVDAVQIINFSLTRETAAVSTISGLINTIYNMLDNPTNVNFPKDNREMDVFLMNDANILRQISVQGHGGFAQVLDPEGQILNKSPYSQQGSIFSASTNKQRFAGGMFIDGYAGNQLYRVRSKTTAGSEANYVFEVDKLNRRPQLPCTFVVEGITYKVNYLRNFVYSTGSNGSSATLVLDSSTPYTNTIAGIITGCTGSGTGTTARITFPIVRASAPFVVGNVIDISGFGGDASGYNGVKTVTACTTAYVEFASGETDAGTGGTVAECFELITAGYRSMLSNDWTQLNDMGYGLFVTNSGISEAVGMFTYYCYNSYYASNGGEIRAVGGSAAHGIYALRAEGADPKEVPDAAYVGRDFSQTVNVLSTGQYSNARGDNELYVTGYAYEPLPDSVIDVMHYRDQAAAAGLQITGFTPAGSKTEVTIAGSAANSFAARDYIQITGINSGSSYSPLFNYQRTLSTYRIDSIKDANTIVLDFPSTNTGTLAISITGASWVGGIATVTFANQTVNPYVVGQRVIVSGILTSTGYNGTYNITAVTPTSISYPVVSNPGAYGSAGTLGVMAILTGVKRTYALNSLNYGDGSSFGGIPNNTARLFLEPISTQPGETGLYAALPTGTPITIRQSKRLWLNGVSNLSASKTSTALLFNADDPDLDVNDVITYSTDELVNRTTGGNQEALASLREGYRYMELTAKVAQRLVGTQYYGAVGATSISVNDLTDLYDIAKLNSGRYAFIWYGVEYVVNSYTASASGVSAFITLNKALVTAVVGFQSEITLFVGPKWGEPASITILISTIRATAFDLLDIGSGSYADTNYPNNIFGAAVNSNLPANEAAEVGKGRIFYTTIDQEGNFKVGKLFGVNQSTGEATLSARISLSNIASLQLSQGVPIGEFSADPNFSSPSSRAVATELATKLYIDRRLGHDGSDRLTADRIGPGFIDTSGKNWMTSNFNMNNSGRIINMLNPAADDDAATKRWLSVPHLGGYAGLAPAAGNLFVYTGTNTADVNETIVATQGFTNAAVTGDLSVTLDPTGRTINFQLVSGTIVNSDIGTTASIEQSKLTIANSITTTSASITGASATATGGIATLTYTSQTNSVTGVATPPVTAGQRVVISGFVEAALNGVFTVNASPAPTSTSFAYTPTTNPGVITTPATGGVITPQRGLATFNIGQFDSTNGHVNVKNNGLAFNKLVKVSQNKILGYVGNNTDNDVTEVSLSDIVSGGGAVLKSQYSSIGVLYQKVGGSSNNADFSVLPASSTTYTTSGTTNAVQNLVSRDNSGNVGFNELILDSVLKMSRSSSAIGNGTDYTVMDILGVTGGKSTVLYGAGSLQKGRIVVQTSDSGTAVDITRHFNSKHVFTDSAGGTSTFVCTPNLASAENLDQGAAGKIYGNWTLQGTSTFEATYADLAEYYEGDKEYEVGTVLVFGGDKEVTTTKINGDTRVAGVVSNTAAYTMNVECPGIKTCIALQGRVPVRVVGKVKKGDMLVTSSIPGVAIVAGADVKVGTVIGKAISSYDSDHIGTVEVSIGRT